MFSGLFLAINLPTITQKIFFFFSTYFVNKKTEKKTLPVHKLNTNLLFWY